ncbi:MAG TPA: hypothetical protein VK638_48215, partial [Edaphobacter sp.]|nr:hypothetical protein [Edaphobacter sp.]
FLNVKAYPHASKIRETMGQSLDELIRVGYLASWQLHPMTTKKGFKFVLTPGQELQRVMSLSSRKQLADKASGSAELTTAQQAAIEALIENGIVPAKAKLLAQQYDADLILDQIEYAHSQMSPNGRQKIGNPAGFIIYTIENALPVPSTFLTSRKKRDLDIEQDREREALRLNKRYLEWKEGLIAAEIAARYPGDELKHKLREVITERKRTDQYFQVMTGPVLEKLALSVLKKDIENELSLPAFEEWAKEQKQGQLF